jgi:hypothetical protein
MHGVVDLRGPVGAARESAPATIAVVNRPGESATNASRLAAEMQRIAVGVIGLQGVRAATRQSPGRRRVQSLPAIQRDSIGTVVDRVISGSR